MDTRFKKTRRNQKKYKQSGGEIKVYPSLSIFDLNMQLHEENWFGTWTLQEKVQASNYEGNPYTYIDRLNKVNFLQNGNLFNTSVAYYTYKDNPYLLGVVRANNGNKDDTRTRTTLNNRDPFSNNSNWLAGWPEPDVPLFFVINLMNGATKFFHMNLEINYMEPQNNFTLRMEDPRIMIHPAAKIVMFYGHHNTYIGGSMYGRIGENLSKELNAGEKKAVDNKHASPQYLYTSYCKLEFIDELLEDHFLSNAQTIRIIQNSTWKLLCSNLLNNSPEKNWVVLDGYNPDEKNPQKSMWFDFVRSIGEFTQAVVVYRSYIHNLTSPPITESGRVNEIATKCHYIQSIKGAVKPPGQPIIPETKEFRVDNNDKISIISYKTKRWLNVLLKLFVGVLNEDTDYSFPSGKLTIRVESAAQRIVYNYPFLDLDGKTYSQVEIPIQDINELRVKFLKGISSGGPACPILKGKEEERLAVGHFKCHHKYVYIAIIAALLYKENEQFRRIVDDQIQEAPGRLIQMDDSEKKAFLEFVSYLTDEVNIFRYTYSVINSQEPMNARAQHNEMNQVLGSYKNTHVLHHDQMYSTYLFKMRKDNFQILTLSPQFYFDFSPTDCTAPVLQFASTISSNGKDTYYIPYGHHDVRARIAAISRDDLHTFLEEEANLTETKLKSDHEYYLGIIKQFFKIHLLKSGE